MRYNTAFDKDMRLLPSDPDVETVVSRIKSGDIDLQPDFQRGEVWSRLKQQRLIDSILRDWHVPPIHVIENPKTRKQEVLDGQQRLAAIRDFVDAKFSVDGKTEPIDPGIAGLDGLRYQQLPEEWRRRFNQFTIRVFRIVDYQPTEPAELFFRLNQPASLTGAEQRNAFFGPVRDQIRDLVQLLEKQRLSKSLIAFSNSRMAYDDVLSRVALAVERRTLAEKITSADLTALYRNDRPLGKSTTAVTVAAVELLASADRQTEPLPKFNKATLFSWLVFLVRGCSADPSFINGKGLASFLTFFEARRLDSQGETSAPRYLAKIALAAQMFAIYDTRASARVADVSSVVLRDAVIWLSFEEFHNTLLSPNPRFQIPNVEALHEAFPKHGSHAQDDSIARSLIDTGWAKLQ